MHQIRIALAQINSTVGDFDGNIVKIVAGIEAAQDLSADIVAFPELALTGYPPEDLTFNPDFLRANARALGEVAEAAAEIVAVVGFLDAPGEIYNAGAVISGGSVAGVCHKIKLPNYGVFDEFRYFSAGGRPLVFELGGSCIGLNICEDIWYPDEPIGSQVAAGADLILNISSSPYRVRRTGTREEMLETRSRDYLTPVAYVNMVGGQDELIFDGNSLVYDEHGRLLARGKSFEEDLIVVDIDLDEVRISRQRDTSGRRLAMTERHPGPVDRIVVNLPRKFDTEGERRRPEYIEAHLPQPLSDEAEVYRALVLGVRDYVQKNGFARVLIGLSGGVDSSLTAVVAVDALGKESVVGVSMPSRFTSEGTRSDAQTLAERLGIDFRTAPIEPVFTAFLEDLKPQFDNLPADVTEQNLQARIRGNILMALSNKFGWLVLTTGNKSETSVGYSTLYGDMAGGFAVIKDVPKTMVYDLCRYRNSLGDKIIPQSVIDREPSAELAEGQKDQDTLPPYEILDRIIEGYVEFDHSLKEMVAAGLDEATVRNVIRMIDCNEYKRRQAPPGIKITSRAFGKDRRFPITNRFWTARKPEVG